MLETFLALMPRLLRMGGKIYGEDLVQETYLALQRNGASDAPEKLIVCIATRKLIDLQRPESIRRHGPLAVETPAPSRTSDPTSIAEAAEMMRTIQDAVKLMSPKLREVVEFVYLSGIPKRADAEREFACTRCLSINTVRTRVAMGLKRLRQLISEGRI
jgi:DNA-directed RNA polymerase specialized sigma24 family protein